MSLMVFTATAVTALVNEPFFQVVNDPKFCLGLSVAYAWSSLAVMTIAWVGDRRVAWHWPVLGGLAGLVSAIFFAPFVLLYLPGAVLAVYLSVFHISKP